MRNVKIVEIVEGIGGFNSDISVEYKGEFMKVEGDSFEDVCNNVFNKLMNGVDRDEVDMDFYGVESVGKDVGLIRFGEDVEYVVFGESNYWFEMKCEGEELS